VRLRTSRQSVRKRTLLRGMIAIMTAVAKTAYLAEQKSN